MKIKIPENLREKNAHAHLLIFLRLLPKQKLLQCIVQVVGGSAAHRGGHAAQLVMRSFHQNICTTLVYAKQWHK